MVFSDLQGYMDLELMDKQVVSKKRVVDNSEVFTANLEVNATLDLRTSWGLHTYFIGL
jgi:hypothetical protein